MEKDVLAATVSRVTVARARGVWWLLLRPARSAEAASNAAAAAHDRDRDLNKRG